tara:strand:- start:2338 stop:2643 length:306 start_codon:yes stop_codon:yes gene_type:complete
MVGDGVCPLNCLKNPLPPRGFLAQRQRWAFFCSKIIIESVLCYNQISLSAIIREDNCGLFHTMMKAQSNEHKYVIPITFSKHYCAYHHSRNHLLTNWGEMT